MSLLNGGTFDVSVGDHLGAQALELQPDHEALVFEPEDGNGGNVFSSVKYHVLGMAQLLLKLYSLFIVLLIVTVFELKKTIVSVFNHLALLFTSILSTCLFILVLSHELVLSLRKNIYYLLHLDDQVASPKLPSSVKYSQLYGLFWSSDDSQKIRISDDFQSIKIVTDDDHLKCSITADSDPTFVDGVAQKNQGINMSFISSPGISKVQQFNHKYKERLKNRPHWWKVGTSPSAIPEIEKPNLPQDKLALSFNSDLGIDLEGNSTELYSVHDVKTISDFGSGKSIKASTPFQLDHEQQIPESLESVSIPAKKTDSTLNSTKLHSKLKLAIESNRHNVLNHYARNLKSFKNNHITAHIPINTYINDRPDPEASNIADDIADDNE